MKQQTEKQERKIINWFIEKLNKIDKFLLEIKGEKRERKSR